LRLLHGDVRYRAARGHCFRCFRLLESEATSWHEAGHAVIGYWLGLGCAQIELMASPRGDDMVAYHGAVHQARATLARANARLKVGRYCAELLADAIFSAAGPAAERKHCLAVGQPIRALLYASGDHAAIENVSKRIAYVEGRRWTRDAFCRLAWRRAQLALEDPTIWSAVGAVAERLNDMWGWMEDEGSPQASMPGDEARAIMRRAGVRPRPLGIKS
jgi:hypothetical protein